MVINRDAGTWESANGSAGKMRLADSSVRSARTAKGLPSAVEMRRVKLYGRDLGICQH